MKIQHLLFFCVILSLSLSLFSFFLLRPGETLGRSLELDEYTVCVRLWWNTKGHPDVLWLGPLTLLLAREKAPVFYLLLLLVRRSCCSRLAPVIETPMLSYNDCGTHF